MVNPGGCKTEPMKAMCAQLPFTASDAVDARDEYAHNKPLLVNIAGPYGVGKDTIIANLMAVWEERILRLTTWTTRHVHPNESHYRQVTEPELEALTSSGTWLVNRQFDDSIAYATSLDEVSEPRTVRFYIHSLHASPSGIAHARRLWAARILSIGVVPSGETLPEMLQILTDRLVGRGRETGEVLQSRILENSKILNYMRGRPVVVLADFVQPVFDNIVVNADLDICVASINDAICRRLKNST